MLPKRRKLTEAKSASADVNSNHSIISMFARQRSHNQLQNVQPDSQRTICHTGVTDRPRLDNRLSLRRKRLCSTDRPTVITISDDADNNNTVDISEPSCTVFHSTDEISNAANVTENDSLSEATVQSTESYPDTVSSLASNQQQSSDFTINQEEALISDESSVSDLLPARQNANDTEEAARVPYYLENFWLVLDTVFKDTFYAELFNDDDLSALHTFKNLSGNCISNESLIIISFCSFGDLLHIFNAF